MNKLNIDEVMALQMMEFAVSAIQNMDINAFDQLYADHPEMEEYITRANDILDRQEKMGIVSISCQDADFPKQLIAIGEDCPAVIHCKGNIDLLKKDKAVAIIGARSADREGNMKAYRLGTKYAEDGYVVVSGLALGCDTSAHRGCLDANGGTIAIVGNGLDITHPRENKPLEDAILKNDGLLVSEHIIGIKANPTRLIARNRLQAAL